MTLKSVTKMGSEYAYFKFSEIKFFPCIPCVPWTKQDFKTQPKTSCPRKTRNDTKKNTEFNHPNTGLGNQRNTMKTTTIAGSSNASVE